MATPVTLELDCGRDRAICPECPVCDEPCPATVTGEICEDVPFELPAPDGEVSFLVDNGG